MCSKRARAEGHTHTHTVHIITKTALSHTRARARAHTHTHAHHTPTPPFPVSILAKAKRRRRERSLCLTKPSLFLHSHQSLEADVFLWDCSAQPLKTSHFLSAVLGKNRLAVLRNAVALQWLTDDDAQPDGQSTQPGCRVCVCVCVCVCVTTAYGSTPRWKQPRALYSNTGHTATSRLTCGEAASVDPHLST